MIFRRWFTQLFYARLKAKMKPVLVPLFLSLLLLLLLAVIVPVMARLNSVRVTSHKSLRKTKNGLKLCALDPANETMSSSSMNDCSLKCARDAICTGYNIKNSLTCDHINTPVGLPVGLLGTTSRTRLPVTCTISSRCSPILSQTASFTRLLSFQTFQLNLTSRIYMWHIALTRRLFTFFSEVYRDSLRVVTVYFYI